MQNHRNPRKKLPKAAPANNPSGPILNTINNPVIRAAVDDATASIARRSRLTLPPISGLSTEFARLVAENPHLARAVLTVLNLIRRDRMFAMHLLEAVAVLVIHLPDEGP